MPNPVKMVENAFLRLMFFCAMGYRKILIYNTFLGIRKMDTKKMVGADIVFEELASLREEVVSLRKDIAAFLTEKKSKESKKKSDVLQKQAPMLARLRLSGYKLLESGNSGLNWQVLDAEEGEKVAFIAGTKFAIKAMSGDGKTIYVSQKLDKFLLEDVEEE